MLHKGVFELNGSRNPLCHKNQSLGSYSFFYLPQKRTEILENIVELLRTANTNEIIKMLVRGFDCPHGVSEVMYDGVVRLITQEWGMESAAIFVEKVQATDDAFYLWEGEVEGLLEEMENGKWERQGEETIFV